MLVSACLWGLPGQPVDAAVEASRLGFDTVDVDPGFKGDRKVRPGAGRLRVSCLAAGHLLPEGARLESADEQARHAAIDHVRRSIGEAVELGANAVYVTAPEIEGADMNAFLQIALDLAEDSALAGIRFCIEHAPGRALASAAETVSWVRSAGHPNLYVLIDIGHCLLVSEDPAAALLDAADRLGYVHFDDNDGHSDLHLGLTDGILRPADVTRTARALAEVGYRGAAAIEVSPRIEDPFGALARSRDILMAAMTAPRP